MIDINAPMIFGTFTTPVAHPPQKAVDLAIVADRAGLDLVTFQDHPYQPSFHDTWTLLSYVASQTENVHLAGNVLNVPLRNPAVLARAAASLDLLSGGRVEMGLGTGAFWDAIVGMGANRLTPGESIEALEEAITIMREIWDTSTRRGVQVEGKHYRVKGAKRGPAPAHDIGIWIGAYKPRLLKLTGRLGDGWLTSLGYLPQGVSSLAEMNRHIDDGAAQVGRNPSEIRRMLNINGQFTEQGSDLFAGPPRQWAEQLAEITQQYRITGYILAADDAYTIETFAQEVVPATRELVAAAGILR